MSDVLPRPETLARLKAVLRRDLKLGPDAAIADDMPLIGGDFDLDSLDLLLVLTSLEKEFGVKVKGEAVGREAFRTVASLARYAEQAAAAAGQAPSRLPSLLEKLPHGEPFRFVTKLTALDDGKSAEGIWSVRGDEPYLAGHFPGRPIVPGVLIAEALAQLSGVVASTDGAATLPAPAQGRLAQVEVKFKNAAVPPAEIALRSRLVQTLGGLYRFDVSAAAGGATLAEGTITLSLSAGDGT
jgi:3-hydroxyacyl-[acyl-carrier-protein] dehydratase